MVYIKDHFNLRKMSYFLKKKVFIILFESYKKEQLWEISSLKVFIQKFLGSRDFQGIILTLYFHQKLNSLHSKSRAV